MLRLSDFGVELLPCHEIEWKGGIFALCACIVGSARGGFSSL